nr:hypothetical protein CFP56_52561 [Quercus suber]
MKLLLNTKSVYQRIRNQFFELLMLKQKYHSIAARGEKVELVIEEAQKQDAVAVKAPGPADESDQSGQKKQNEVTTTNTMKTKPLEGNVTAGSTPPPAANLPAAILNNGMFMNSCTGHSYLTSNSARRKSQELDDVVVLRGLMRISLRNFVVKRGGNITDVVQQRREALLNHKKTFVPCCCYDTLNLGRVAVVSFDSRKTVSAGQADANATRHSRAQPLAMTRFPFPTGRIMHSPLVYLLIYCPNVNDLAETGERRNELHASHVHRWVSDFYHRSWGRWTFFSRAEPLKDRSEQSSFTSSHAAGSLGTLHL